MVTGCAGVAKLSDPPPSSPPPTSPTSTDTVAEPDPQMVSARSRARERFLDALSVLPAGEYTAAFGYTEYSICTDNAADWEVSANGRLDRKEPRPSTREDAERIRDALMRAGWTPFDTDVSPGGIRELTERWIVTAAQGDLSIYFNLYTEDSYVLITVAGPCLPATPSQAEAYFSAGGQHFRVPRVVGGP